MEQLLGLRVWLRLFENRITLSASDPGGEGITFYRKTGVERMLHAGRLRMVLRMSL